MITFKQKGNFSKTERFMERVLEAVKRGKFDSYGQEGVAALQAATPMDSGETAKSWYYEIKHSPGSITISWLNSNIVDGVNIAIILQYGHGTGTGGYVQGTDYINPALKPIFEKMADSIWREVTRL